MRPRCAVGPEVPPRGVPAGGRPPSAGHAQLPHHRQPQVLRRRAPAVAAMPPPAQPSHATPGSARTGQARGCKTRTWRRSRSSTACCGQPPGAPVGKERWVCRRWHQGRALHPRCSRPELGGPIRSLLFPNGSKSAMGPRLRSHEWALRTLPSQLWAPALMPWKPTSMTSAIPTRTCRAVRHRCHRLAAWDCPTRRPRQNRRACRRPSCTAHASTRRQPPMTRTQPFSCGCLRFPPWCTCSCTSSRWP
mmetsp:Transcript_11838/g.37012  ORF Transcript_11838/g.37012 Transcript_11838/m.37012 type:complete len:248 (-) Transcript_11838:1581-2324(-)